ncbi:MAG: hypothetical protein ACRDI0_01185 [Actinomycetota bacterium]
MSDRPYRVEAEREEGEWTVRIVDDGDREVFRRACADEAQARLLESTVRQHLRWLSPERFRQYYRLP